VRAMQLMALTAAMAAIRAAAGDPTDMSAPPPARGAPAAIVCQLEDEATVLLPGSNSRQALKLLDVLPAGSVVTTQRGATVVLGLANGVRYRLMAGTTIEVLEDGLEASQGSAEPLTPVSQVVELAPIVLRWDDFGVGASSRIRGDTPGREPSGLSPPPGARVLSHAVTLSYPGLEGYSGFVVTVRKGCGEPIFQSHTSDLRLSLPPGLLEADQTYHWSVKTEDNGRPPETVSAAFSTLGEDALRARASIDDLAMTSNDPSLWVLLAGLDYSMWLDDVACQDLSHAAAHGANAKHIAELRQLMACGPSADL
jgi:hypothetical protein